MKKHNIENYEKELLKHDKQRKKLYNKFLTKNDFCPICQNLTTQEKSTKIYDSVYLCCGNCKHHFIAETPSEEEIQEFYRTNEEYQKTYIDKTLTEQRIKDITIPKAEWVIEEYKRIHGRDPINAIDLGAGGGHFVEACNRKGIIADGIEISSAARAYAMDSFNIDLIDNNIFEDDMRFLRYYDIITLWGVIEHSNTPHLFIERIREFMHDQSILVIGVPRWESFSTIVQKTFSRSILRHLEPLGHINIFSEKSLKTLCRRNKLEVVSIWRYGMDAYELFSQLAYNTSNTTLMKEAGEYINDFQKELDKVGLSDEMVFITKNEVSK